MIPLPPAHARHADPIRQAETAAWLDALYSRCTPDDGEIVLVEPNKKSLLSVHRVGNSQALIEAAKVMNGRSDHYAKINLMDAQAMRQRSIRDRKGKNIVGNANEVKTVVSLHLDVDAGKSSKYHSRSDVLNILDRMPCKPSLVVNSDGSLGGFHVYWILADPFRITTDADRTNIQTIAARWQCRLNKLMDGKLDSTCNIDRVLRVVGQHRSSGNVVSCEYHDPTALYTLSELTLPPAKDEIVSQAKQVASSIVRATLGPMHGSDAIAKATRYLAKMPPSISGGGGHNACLKAASVLVNKFELDDDDAFNLLATEFNPRCSPPWSEKELRHKVESAKNRGVAA